MILLDFNQIAIGSVMVSLHRGEELSESLIRHLILNQIRFYRSKFVEEYGEMVICCDSKHYWRRDYFPNYKIHRKKDRESSGHDWDVIFTCLNMIRDELKEVFPYKVVEVYGAEADDIIATLTKFVSNEIISALIDPQEKMLILSSDKDFIQLHSDTVDQFSPVTKKIINGKDPVKYLKEHILKGDRSDGVPNVLSPDETFVENIRQKPLRKTTIVTIMEAMKEYEPEMLYHLAKCPEDTWRRNYRRNETLIDLSKIPETITREINMEYKEAKVGERNQLLNYFIEKRLTQLIDNVGDF